MNSVQLPDPIEKPHAHIVIWDGQCNFCRSQVERLRKWDAEQLAYLSLHDPRAAELCPDLSAEELAEQMWVISADRRSRHGGADAARFLSLHLPKLWWLMPLLHVPFTMPVWRWAYRQIAKRRYKISGRNCESGSCRIP